MDRLRRAAWSRRHLSLLATAFPAWLITPVDVHAGKARKRRRKKRCRRFAQACQPGGKRKCCKTLACEPNLNLGGNRCCRKEAQACAAASECCSGFCLDDRCQPGECREVGAPCDQVIPCCSGVCDAIDHCGPPLT